MNSLLDEGKSRVGGKSLLKFDYGRGQLELHERIAARCSDLFDASLYQRMVRHGKWQLYDYNIGKGIAGNIDLFSSSLKLSITTAVE